MADRYHGEILGPATSALEIQPRATHGIRATQSENCFGVCHCSVDFLEPSLPQVNVDRADEYLDTRHPFLQGFLEASGLRSLLGNMAQENTHWDS